MGTADARTVQCQKENRRKDTQELYHVREVTPPPKDLGVYRFPKNTQCGELIHVRGNEYLVSGVTYRYQLKKGRYVQDTVRLDVQGTGRYFLNLMLDKLLQE